VKQITYIALVLVLTAGAALCASISIDGPDRYAMLEGQTYAITWRSDGIETVSVVAYGDLTPLGTASRGDFSIVIAENVPAATGRVEWKTPWIDAKSFFIKLKAYGSDGSSIDSTARGYGFRPAVLAKRTRDGIYLDLHKPVNHRIYVQKDGRITHAYLSSSSENYLWRPANVHPSKPHDHAGVYRVLSKTRSHWSTMFNVEMPWAMRYHGGHFIHATIPRLYSLLGSPASNGCNRMTMKDARELYMMTPIGTRVEVIGPPDPS
jgi:hypothetical protein